jgi:hypothetical protein
MMSRLTGSSTCVQDVGDVESGRSPRQGQFEPLHDDE